MNNHDALDLRDLKENLGDRPEVLTQLVEHLQTALPQALSDLRAAIATGDPERVRRLAHGLKSPLGTFGAEQARRLAWQLERIGASGDLSEAAEVMVPLAGEINRIINFFAQPDWRQQA